MPDTSIGEQAIPQLVPQGPQPRLEEAPTVAGIVAEYNPFHKGHEWMIRQLRRGGVETVVCVMSGPFVQRAEGAVLPCHERARAALEGGADLVLRLPVGWATASAEGFARGGVGLLSALGCIDLLAFGAECADLPMLEAVVDVLSTDAFTRLLKEGLSTGVSFAVARAAAAETLMPGAEAILRSPNNILAVEYLKALRFSVPQALRELMPEDVRWRVVNGLFGNTADQKRLFMLPVATPLPRVGAQHDGAPAQGIASASWLRQQAEAGGVAAWEAFVPQSTMPVYRKAEAAGLMLDEKRLETVILSRLRGMNAAAIGRHPGAGEGLENRLAAAASRATTLEELYAAAKSKRFAHSRVRRLALSAALGLPPMHPVIPPFAQMLAANGRGLALMKRIKEKAMIPVSTSLAKLKASGEYTAHAVDLEAAAEDLYALCLKNPQPGGGAFTQPAAIMAKTKD